MFILKGCPRCAGDLQTGIDDDLTCIQCGKDISGDEKTKLMQRVRPVRQPVAAQ